MKILFTLTLLVSMSTFGKCVEMVDSNRISVINIISSYNYSRCTNRELAVAKKKLERYLHQIVNIMKEEYNKKESEAGNAEKFRILTEINAAKISYQIITNEIKDRESL